MLDLWLSVCHCKVSLDKNLKLFNTYSTANNSRCVELVVDCLDENFPWAILISALSIIKPAYPLALASEKITLVIIGSHLNLWPFRLSKLLFQKDNSFLIGLDIAFCWNQDVLSSIQWSKFLVKRLVIDAKAGDNDIMVPVIYANSFRVVDFLLSINFISCFSLCIFSFGATNSNVFVLIIKPKYFPSCFVVEDDFHNVL